MMENIADGWGFNIKPEYTRVKSTGITIQSFHILPFHIKKYYCIRELVRCAVYELDEDPRELEKYLCIYTDYKQRCRRVHLLDRTDKMPALFYVIGTHPDGGGICFTNDKINREILPLEYYECGARYLVYYDADKRLFFKYISDIVGDVVRMNNNITHRILDAWGELSKNEHGEEITPHICDDDDIGLSDRDE